MSYAIICADVLEWAAEYEGPKFHALLCDPPYELGFMGKDFDKTGISFRPATWAALARHLHPGGFIMAFASSRGWHRLAVAIEDAGLVIHPSIFGWVTGQGFPKATRVDTQVDRAAGAERPDKIEGGHTGYGRAAGDESNEGALRYDKLVPHVIGKGSHAGNDAQTPLAQAWEGHRYGLQAMKPALEPIIVAQLPYAGKPVDSITETGAGALWIDGGRIGAPEGITSGGKPTGNNNPCYMSKDNDPRTERAAPHPAGRWPSQFYLSHTPDCVRVGERRVKGTGAFPRKIRGVSPIQMRTNEERPSRIEMADADGLETVAAWDCFKGWEGELPSYAYRNGVLSPSDDAAYLLDQLSTLPEDVRCYSMTCNSLLHHVSEVYHNGRKLSGATEGDLIDDVSCALSVSGFPGFQVDCPSCRRLCDGLLRRVLVAAQDDPPSLPDVLAGVHSDLSSLLHNQQSQSSDHPSNRDDSGLTCPPIDNGESNRPDTCPSLVTLPETESGISDKTGSGVGPCGEPENILENRTPGGGSRVSQCCSACSTAIVKLVSLLCADLAWRLLLPGQIIQRNEIHVKLNPCPVLRLGEQSGVLQPVGGPKHTTHSTGMFGIGQPGRIYKDRGDCARFYFQADWSHEVAERLATCDPVKYQAKAARQEKETGLLGVIPCIRCGGLSTETHVDDKGKVVKCHRCSHPTVKPIMLSRWLATLLLPPKAYAPRRILVPFAGSGSEMIGALLAGWEEIVGIDNEREYVDIAEARLAHWASKPIQGVLC